MPVQTIKINGQEFKVISTEPLGPNDTGPMVYSVEIDDEMWKIIRRKLTAIAERAEKADPHG